MINQFVETLLHTMDNTNKSKWAPGTIVTRNLLFYAWFLRYSPKTNPNATVEIAEEDLLVYLGTGYRREVNHLIQNTDLSQYVKRFERNGNFVYRFETDVLGQIQVGFERAGYPMHGPIPYMDISLTELVNHYFSDSSYFLDAILGGFNQLFNEGRNDSNVLITPTIEGTGVLQSRSLQMPWAVMLSCYASATAVTRQEFTEILMNLNRARGKFLQNGTFQVVPILLFAPNGADANAAFTPDSNAYTYHLSPLAAARMFNLFKARLADQDWTTMDFAHYFDAFFPIDKGMTSALSELRGVERL